MRIRILFVPLLIAALGMPVMVAAQQDDGAAATQQNQFSEQQLSQFADAYKGIMGVQQEYAQRLSSVTDREKAVEIQKQANQEMLQALRKTGMSLDEYRAIARAASQNPELAQRIQALL